jgi:hypothetical protein
VEPAPPTHQKKLSRFAALSPVEEQASPKPSRGRRTADDE